MKIFFYFFDDYNECELWVYIFVSRDVIGESTPNTNTQERKKAKKEKTVKDKEFHKHYAKHPSP